MPCDQIILNRVEIQAANLDLLTRALENILPMGRLGGVYAGDLAKQIILDGFVRLPAGQEYMADKIRQEYSRQTIQAAARKCGLRGWKITQKSPQKLVATRRT